MGGGGGHWSDGARINVRGLKGNNQDGQMDYLGNNTLCLICFL